MARSPVYASSFKHFCVSTIYFLPRMNVSEQDLEYFLSSRFATHRYPINTAAIITLYSTVAVVGFIENAIIFSTLLAIGDLRGGSAANVFVGALTVSDMILCVFNVPIQLYYELGEPSEMSATTCRVLFASLGVPTHVSCILILLIAIDRYRSVRFPTVFTSSSVTSASSTGGGGSVATGSMRSSTALLLVLLSILFSLLAAFPVAYYTDAQQVSTQTFVNDLNVSISPSTTSSLDTVAPIANDMQDKPHFPMYCVEQWPSPLRRLIYSVLVVIAQFLTPLIATLILYAHIGWWLAHRRGQLYRMQKTSTSHIQLAARLEMRTRRTHRILVGIVACFAGCWTPWTLYSLYLECTAYAIAGVPVDEMAMVDPGSQDVAVDANLKTTDLVLKLFALSSTCANPFLYGWLNENIRKSIIRRTGLCKKKSTHHDQTTVISMNANYSHMDKATSKPHCPTNRKSHP